MKTKIGLVSVALLLSLVVSCKNNDSNDLKTICPLGAPTLAFYNQGDNKSFVTDSTPSNVSRQLLGIDYDFVVFDSINGLNTIKKNNADFKLIDLITGGNFYLISYDIDESHIPSAQDTFKSFNENGLPDLVYKKLVASYSGWSNWNMPDAIYLSSTNDVSKALIQGNRGYYFIAEPSLYAAKKQLGSNANKVRIVSNLRETWAQYSGLNAIPQAGLFVRTSTYQQRENDIKDYVNFLRERKDNCVDNPVVVKETIDNWNSDNTIQAARFGFNSSIAYDLQKDNSNKLGIVKSDSISNIKVFINDFINALGNVSYTTFSDNLFVN